MVDTQRLIVPMSSLVKGVLMRAVVSGCGKGDGDLTARRESVAQSERAGSYNEPFPREWLQWKAWTQLSQP